MYVPSRLQRIEDLISTVADVTIEEMRGRSRKKTIVDARHAVWFIANKQLEYTYAQIGRIYEKDHTSVMSGVARIQNTYGSQLIEKLKEVLPEAFENNKPLSAGRVITDWNWGVEKVGDSR